jgi:uncharacterized membrane protein YfcA
VIGAVTALVLDARVLALVFGTYLVLIAIREIVQVLPGRRKAVAA